MNKCKIR